MFGGIFWGLDTVILGIAMAFAPYFGSDDAVAFASVVGSFLHDAFCAIWLFIYMAFKGRLKDTVQALKTRHGKFIMLGALLGGPIGMTGYVVAISNIGAGHTAIISAFYPAVGALLAVFVLKERMHIGQFIALLVAIAGVIVMGYTSAGDSQTANAALGLAGALCCVLGWGSEAVIVAYGMREDSVDNETALQIRETTSAIVYGVVILPLFGAWNFAATSVPTFPTIYIALAGIAGAVSYLLYYKGIDKIGAARGMALNITYSAWAVLFGLLLLGTIPTVLSLVCCAVIICGTVLAACDWDELFGKKIEG